MKRCLLCTHFYFTAYEPDWSEVTPGSAASVGCARGIRFDVVNSSGADFENLSEHGFFGMMRTAEHCDAFEQDKER